MLRISSFSIEGLNGLFNYPDCSVSGCLEDLIILYGDNGSGKTTVLHLIFHLLSSGPAKGHLNAIARVPFKALKVTLSDGTVVSAERKESAQSIPIIFNIERPNSKSLRYSFVPESMRDKVFQEALQREFLHRESARTQTKTKSKGKNFSFAQSIFSHSSLSTGIDDESDHKTYVAALQSLDLNCYFMATDRKVRNDSIEEKRPEQRSSEDNERYDSDIITRVRSRYLRDALNSASRYLNRQIIGASNTGSKNTNDIYAELIGRIAKDKLDDVKTDLQAQLKEALGDLKKLEAQNQRLSNLGISPALDLDSVSQSVESATSANHAVLNKILKTYIDSLNARLSALNPVGDVIETFLNLLNDLFKHKFVSFSPSQGFTVYSSSHSNELDVEQLSSGEQQLLLMFCYLLISNDHQCVFMIDEPEISLNVKWQRELIDAMRLITKGSKTQIIIATHSIELLSQYSDMVIQLDPQISQGNRQLNGSPKEEN